MFDEKMHFRHHHGGRMRDSAYNIKEIIDFLEIKNDWEIADLGAGDGYFSKEFVKYAKSVTAIDIDNSYFDEMNSLGIKTIKADLCKFDQGKYDLTFMANVYHGLRLECKENLLENIRKITKKYFAIMDFNELRMFGPPMRIKKDEVIKDLESQGFKLYKEKDLKYHYLLVFEKIGD
ncbi:MAG: class I SAM-dependent methyltransferase [Thermoplasmata archaeon]|nr:class I SAM-dependent methyltransferase [Thermoplasmata archaeon]